MRSRAIFAASHRDLQVSGNLPCSLLRERTPPMTAESALRRKSTRRPTVGRRSAGRAFNTGRSGWAIAAAAWTILLIVPIALLLLEGANGRRVEIEQQADGLARAAAMALDGQSAAAEALLRGLAASPTQDGDPSSRLYAQAIDAAKPPGSWIELFGRAGEQQFSTLEPYGTSLPPASMATQRSLAEIAQNGHAASLDLSPETESVGFGIPIARRGEVAAVLVLIMAKRSLAGLLDDIRLPAGWCGVVQDSTDRVVLRWFSSAEAGDGRDDRHDQEGCGTDMASSPRQSRVTGWSTTVAAPLAQLEAPMRRALALAGSGSILVIMVMGLAFLADARINRPFRARVAAEEERFRVMADTVPSILFVTDGDGRCEYVNHRFCEYTGMTPGEALGLGWVDAVHPEEQRRVIENLVRPAPADDLRLNEIRMRAKDGSYRWFLGRLRPLRNPDGTVEKWFGSSTDIDGLKQSGATLQQINARLSAVLSSIDECYYTIDTDWRITHINPQAASFLGGTAETLVGRSIWEVAPELRDLGRETDLVRAMQERVPIRLERRSVMTPDRWLAINCYPWTEGLSVFFRDITRRKCAEIALRRMQELLQRTMDALSAQIAILDEKGVVVAANAAWRRSSGSTGCGVGRDYLAACPAIVPNPAQAQQMIAGLNAVLRQAQNEALVYYARPTDKGSRWFQMRATRFDAEEGLRVVVAHEDITEIKQAETGLRDLTSRLLRVQDDERRRMARELHDTTAQNLAAAILELDRLRQGVPASDDASEDVWDELRGLIDRALQEIRTLSYLLHPPLLDELGLASALRWCVRGFENRSGVAVSLTVQEDLGRMPPAVESALFRVVQEGLTNIHRHSGSATAQIRLMRSAEEVALEIRDQGRGMARSDGADPALLGVGVSGMRARLHQLGGELAIHSTDRGTTVTATVSLDRSRSISAGDELASRALSE
jgi:two-component system, NarL family, sensor kinase